MTPQVPTAHLLLRDCPAIRIPSGEPVTLKAGTDVFLTQSLGGTVTVQAPALGGLFRISGADADALGLSSAAGDDPPRDGARPGESGPVREDALWDQLKNV
ncbi:MAG TPA: putative Fe-S cluster assembly protein SufT, partial [Thermoanaerobaculia bacterium]|nr:putative Fe-S cluster assembly protein SufT [Thermoanaerobaculia bacterium]